MKTWKVTLFAITNTAVYFWCPVTGIPAETAEEAGAKAVAHAMTNALQIQVMLGAPSIPVKAVFSMPFQVEEDKKVEVYTQLPPKGIVTQWPI